ncbi:MAG: hypothetical protein H6813_04390 [Phycisphaeraceae bacterium]|nr:hypothetical protein [Phycisphaeraceae bacterium]MCB9847187.1 hypothetical protein [Phycisphaeraceae bacterium]
MINTIISMITGYSVIDAFPAIPGAVLGDLIVVALTLMMALGAWLVTTGDERIRSMALVNIGRLLARGFSVLFVLLIALMLANEILSAMSRAPLFPVQSESGAAMFDVLFLVFAAPWAGFTALHVVWLRCELGQTGRDKARRDGLLLVLGGLGVVGLMFMEAGVWGLSASGALVLDAIFNLMMLVSIFVAFAVVIRLSRGLKPG